jgi:hypothetical protein
MVPAPEKQIAGFCSSSPRETTRRRGVFCRFVRWMQNRDARKSVFPTLENMTTQPLEQTIGKCEPMPPAWFRIPDACAVSGIGRSLLYRHLTSGRIRSVCLRDPDNVRGIRLVNADSLFAFIESHAA